MRYNDFFIIGYFPDYKIITFLASEDGEERKEKGVEMVEETEDSVDEETSSKLDTICT